MSFSMSASLNVFGHPITITPNTEFPHRIEFNEQFTIEGTTIQSDFQKAFGSSTVPGLSLLTAGTSLTFSQVVVDTQTQDFQMAVSVKVDTSEFFLTKFFSNVISDIEVDLYMSCQKTSSTQTTQTE